MRPIEQLKSDSDGGLVAGTNEKDSGVKVKIAATDYPDWLTRFTAIVRKYRKTQLTIYKVEVWASGSLSGCQNMAIRVGQQLKSYQIIKERSSHEFQDGFDTEQDDLEILKLTMEKNQPVDKADYHGGPAKEFAQNYKEKDRQKIIERVEDIIERNQARRGQLLAPMERVITAEFELLEQLQGIIAEGKQARSVLERDPKLGGSGGEGEQQDGGGGGEQEDKEKKTAWPMEMPAGRWEINVGKNPSEAARAVVFKAAKGKGQHQLSKEGRVVIVKSKKDAPWKLGVRYLESEKWERSRLKMTDKGGWFKVHTDDKAGTNDYQGQPELDIKPHKGKDESKSESKGGRESRGVRIPQGMWTVMVSKKQASYDQRFIIKRTKTDGTYDGNTVGRCVEVKSEQAWRLYVEHNDGKKWSTSKDKGLEKKGDGFQVNTEDWTDNDYDNLVLSVKRAKARSDVAPESPLPPVQQEGLSLFETRLQKAHIRPKLIEPLSQALEISADKDKVGLRKLIKPIARQARDQEIETLTTHEQITKSTVKTAKMQGSRLFKLELERIAAKRDITGEDEIETSEESQTSPSDQEHLNVNLDPNLQSKIDDKLTGSGNKRDVNRHRRMAQEAEGLLNRKKGTRRSKRRHASELERVFTGLLPGKIGMSITFQEGEGSSPKMQDVQIRIAPNDTILDTTTDITELDDDGDKLEPPTLSKREKKRYRRMASHAEDALQGSGGSISDKLMQSRDLESLYNPQIRQPLDMDILFEGPSEDSAQDVEVRISPDDEKLTRPHDPKDDIVESFNIALDESRLDLNASKLTGLSDEERKQSGDDFAGLSNDNRNEIEILVSLARELAGSRKAKKKDGLTDNNALSFIISLAGRPSKICRSVVVMLGDDFAALLETARFDRLWASEESAAATMLLLNAAPDSFTRKMANDILSTSFFSFDWAVNRFEARLAWELLLTLPYGERVNLLTSKGWGKDEAEKELAKRSRKRISKNLSQEYRESSRYDLYSGDKSTAYGTLADVSTLPENATQQEKDAFAKERKRIQTETAVYEEVTDQNASKVVARDSDRQGLLAQMLDPELWSTGPEPKLRALLKMVIQADEAPFVQELIKKHWAAHENLFMGLGFLRDGRFSELIEDNTFNTTLGRIFGALGSLGGVFSMVGVLLLDKDVGTLNLRSVESMFLRDFAGIELENVQDPDARERLRKSTGIEFEEIKGTKARKALGILLGSAGAVTSLLGVTGWGPDKLLDTLKMGGKAGSMIQDAINKNDVKVVGEGDQHTDPNMANKLILSQDDDTGATRINLPLLPIAGQSAIFGTTTVKTGSAAIINAEIELKLATAKDNRRHMELTVNAVKINDLSIIGPDDMMIISAMEIEGFRFFADIADAKPANMLTRILFDVQNAVINILQMIPGYMGTIGVAAGVVSDYLTAGLSNMDLDASDVENIQFGFNKASIKGITSSKGDYIGELSIGKTDINAVPAISALLDWKSESELTAEISSLDEEITKVTEK